MVSLSTAEETILKSDRVPVYLGTNRFFLKKGVQSTNRSIEIPNAIIQEQGNVENRGVSIQAPQITFTLEDLSVDMDMEQLLGDQYLVPSTTFTGNANLKNYVASGTGFIAYAVGATDNINNVVVAVTSSSIRIGEGAKVSSFTSSNVITLVSAAKAVNFYVGDKVYVQKDATATNSTLATITNVSGTKLTITGYNLTSAPVAGSTTYVYVGNNTAVSKALFVSGVPAVMKGIELYSVNRTGYPTIGSASTYITTFAVTPVTSIDSNYFRDSNLDVLMVYNDYNDAPIFSRYAQDCGCTSVGFNFTADGNATQSYNFNTGKSIDYVGYVLRKSTVASASAASFVLKNYEGIFTGAETVDPIEKNSTFNSSATNEKNFLKVTTLTNAGVKKVWKEVASGTSTLLSDEYKFVNASGIITFGATVTKGTRIETTYLCEAANVDSADTYIFNSTAFDHTGTPDAVTGKYQPLVINTTDYNDRVDGLESSSINLTFSRDFFMAQGILATRNRPASNGNVDGTFSTREGFSKTMKLVTDGNYDSLTTGLQMDASKSSVFTNSNTIPLMIGLFNPKDNSTLVKQVKIESIQVTNITNANSVGGDSTFQVNFLGKKGNVIISR